MGKSYRIGFFGDFTTGENYQIKAEQNERVNVLRQFGYDYLFKRVEDLLNRFDMNIFNLETPLTNCVKSSLLHKKAVLHWADGEIVPKYLKQYKVEAVSLGNNHAMDYERQGLVDTLNYLNNNGICAFGAGLNLEAAQKPFMKEIHVGEKSVNLYVIAGYKYRKDYDVDFNFYAKLQKEGVFCLTPESSNGVIRTIKEIDKNSIVVVFPHFGFDLLKTTDMQREYAHAFIDSGADFVFGHGPHMMNSAEIYNGKIILYGIGNFIFPTDFKGKPLPYNMSVELKFDETPEGIDSSVYVYPLYMDNQSNKTQTRPIYSEELDEFLGLFCEDNPALKDKLSIENLGNMVRIGFSK